MKFMRRPDIDTVARVQMAAQAFLGLGVYGEITRIANGYRVSRLFVYKLVWQLLTLYALAILKIELVDNREATTWKKHWEALAEAGLIAHQTVVADQGAGLVKGCALMGLTHHPDLFHLLRPLARFGERFYRQALAAIAWEYERGGVGGGRSEPVINKRMAS